MDRIYSGGIVQCAFCAVGGAAKFRGTHIWDTVLAETKNFIVVPSKGALIEGWILVVPRQHFLSLGALPLEMKEELRGLVKDMSSMLSQRYCPPTFFEHGPSKPTTAFGCGVDHAHLHLVPLVTKISEAATVQMGAPEIMDEQDFWEQWPIAIRHQGGSDYLMLGEPSRPVYVWESPTTVSQFFRRLIAASIGLPQMYDYRQFPFEDNVCKTILTLRGELLDDLKTHAVAG